MAEREVILPPDPPQAVGGITLMEGDCRERLREIPDGTVDCVIMDPPYGKDYQSNRQKSQIPNPKSQKIIGDRSPREAVELLKDIRPELFRVLKPDAHVYLFCDWRSLPSFREVFHQALVKRFSMAGLLVFAKGRGMGSRTGSQYVSGYELCLWITKGGRKLHGNPCDLIDVYRQPNKLHPTQKWLSGIMQLIENSTRPGEVVLDPFAGSGTTGAACRAFLPGEERRAILCEIDAGNCEVIRRRLGVYGLGEIPNPKSEILKSER